MARKVMTTEERAQYNAARRAFYNSPWARAVRENDAYARTLVGPDGFLPSRETAHLVDKHWLTVSKGLPTKQKRYQESLQEGRAYAASSDLASRS